MSEATYVGTLYAIQIKGEDPMEVARCKIGVDPEYGIVQAPTVGKLMRGEYTAPKRYARGKKCVRLWYHRSRIDYPNDAHWFHDLDDCRAYLSQPLDKDKGIADREINAAAPQVVLIGTDVEICPQPGQFLCG